MILATDKKRQPALSSRLSGDYLFLGVVADEAL